jgi:hypothetical protein
MMSVTTWASAAGEFGEQRFAEFGPTLAAILGEEGQATQCVDAGTLDLLAAAFLRRHKTGFGEDGKVGGEGALRQSARVDQRAGGQAIRFVSDQQAERVKARGVREGCQSDKTGFDIHASGIADYIAEVNTDRYFTMG